jgi:hypothetical protein
MTNMAAAKSGSGVRARWIELPDCSKWCNHLDQTTGKAVSPAGTGQPAGEYIPLRDDLANAIIATCKGTEPGFGPNACPAADTTAADDAAADSANQSWTAKAASTIFDPVVKTATVIPDHEHQVEQASAANATHQSDQPVGPKGDFYQHWNWEHQSKDTQWSATGPYGTNYTGNMPSEKVIGSDPTDTKQGPATTTLF